MKYMIAVCLMLFSVGVYAAEQSTSEAVANAVTQTADAVQNAAGAVENAANSVVEEVNVESMLKEAFASIITEAAETLQSTKDFLIRETPLVVQELLQWKFALTFIYAIIGYIMMGLIIAYWVTVYKRWPSIRGNENHEMGYVMVGGLGTIVFLIISSNLMNLTWLQIWLAPRVYLIEYAAELIK